ncbi:serine/threonine-protein kinase [Myxococcaceae bacterium GXIMD 01537]
MTKPPERSQPKPNSVLFTAGLTSYSFIRSLGTRGNGELLLARRSFAGLSGAPVVIKRLSDPDSAYARARLMEELQLLLQLNHPLIAQVFLVRTVEGVPHIVMEHVEGSTLETLINCAAMRGHPLSEAFAAYVVGEIAEALHHAHTLADTRGRPLGIVHRDVSPRGIILTNTGRVKLTDFASAWSRQEGRLHTEGPVVRGDIAYASPEQLLRKPLDGRSDLFSLGVVLLELLTDKHLLDLELVERAARDAGPMAVPELWAEEPSWLPAPEMARRMACVRPEHVDHATRGLSEPMRAVVRRALCLDPAGRYPTGLELRDELWAVLGGLGRCYGPRDAEQEASEVRARFDALCGYHP